MVATMVEDAGLVTEIDEKRDDDNKHKHKHSSSSSDSETDNFSILNAVRKNRLFGRQKPLHLVLGGGKCNFCFWVFLCLIPSL